MRKRSLKKSLEMSNNVLEQKRKNGQAETFHKKDTHAYNDGFKLCSGTIKNMKHSWQIARK